MEILAYQKKKTSWQVRFDESGQIQTGMTDGWRAARNGGTMHELTAIPIFQAKLKYHGHYQGTKSVMIQFKGCEEDSLISILRGAGPCVYDMDRENGMSTMEHLILQDNPKYEYHGNGWFTGIFTFEKRGKRVFIKPYEGDISKERSIEDVENI